MTLYSIFVADKKLNEVDCTGIDYVTVREMKKMYPISEHFPEQTWHSMDDDVQILHAPDEAAFGKLHVFQWEIPPYDLAHYSDKAFIYGIEGNWNADFLSDLLQYIKEQLSPKQNVELLRFWAGDYPLPKLKKHTISINELNLAQLQEIEGEEYIRVQLV